MKGKSKPRAKSRLILDWYGLWHKVWENADGFPICVGPGRMKKEQARRDKRVQGPCLSQRKTTHGGGQ